MSPLFSSSGKVLLVTIQTYNVLVSLNLSGDTKSISELDEMSLSFSGMIIHLANVLPRFSIAE